MPRGNASLLAGLLTGALCGASLAMFLTPPAPTTRELLRAKARAAGPSQF